MGGKYNLEILAPAGSYDIFTAVIAAGADAVYLGGDMFGARAYAGNFARDELLKALDYAHVRGKKIYLTVNTLLKENELSGMLIDYLAPYYEAGLDAVIVQDMGVFKTVHDTFPKLPIHASTLMTVTGSEGAAILKSMGATRVVTARELNIAEIKKIHDTCDIEIESFVHGALCYCYSGQCPFSSMK
ncbi:MAG: U32 family peptidase, partial [Lachnospira sp.]|nr:U32 family peptidase [Lachnospira sp.]